MELNWVPVRTVLNEVMDFFFGEDILYMWADPSKSSVDRFQEDKDDIPYTNFELKCMVEPLMNRASRVDTYEGANFDDDELQVSIKFDQLKELGLIDSNNKVLMSSISDMVLYKGNKFKVLNIAADGLMTNINTIVYLIIKKQPNGS